MLELFKPNLISMQFSKILTGTWAGKGKNTDKALLVYNVDCSFCDAGLAQVIPHKLDVSVSCVSPYGC